MGSVDGGCGNAWERGSVSPLGAVGGDFVVSVGFITGDEIAVGAIIG